MTEDEIKKRFEAQLEGSSWWARLAGSQFVDGLSRFISMIVNWMTDASARDLQESFLSRAIKRSSILAGAEDAGYIGLKISPSWGKASIKNKGTHRITLPAKTPIMSKATTNYIFENAIDLAPNETTDETIYQLWLVALSGEVAETKQWQEFVLPVDVTLATHKIEVLVDGEHWEHNYKFRNSDGDSKIYMEFYKPTEQIGVRFGDGIKGKMPEAGSTITVIAYCTDGETTLIDGQTLQLTGANEYLNSDIEILTTTPITGGAAAESTEETRNGALYTTAFDDETVWRNDYAHFIRTNVAGIVWISFWGEKDQENLIGHHSLDFVNQIYVAAYSDIKDDSALQSEIIPLLERYPEFNKEYNYVIRREAPYFISVTGFVFSHSSASDAEKAVRTALEATYGKDIKAKPQRVYRQDIWDLINDLVVDTGIDEFNLEVTDLPTTVPVDTYSYLDIDLSSIKFEYREID